MVVPKVLKRDGRCEQRADQICLADWTQGWPGPECRAAAIVINRYATRFQVMVTTRRRKKGPKSRTRCQREM